MWTACFRALQKCCAIAVAAIVTKAPVSAISRANGTWTLETPQGSFSAPVIVNAAGAWADEIARLAGVQPLGLTPMRRSAVILPAPEGHDVTGWPAVRLCRRRLVRQTRCGQADGFAGG